MAFQVQQRVLGFYHSTGQLQLSDWLVFLHEALALYSGF